MREKEEKQSFNSGYFCSLILSSQKEMCMWNKKNGLLFCLKIQSFNCQTIVISLP